MSVQATSEMLHLRGIIAHLNAGPAETAANAYSLGDLQKMGDAKPRDGYTEVIVVRRGGGEVPDDGERRFGGLSGNEMWRVYTRAVAELEDNAIELRHRVTRRLWGHSVVIDERPTTSFDRGQTDDPIKPDEGWFSGSSEWVYTHAPA